jgi:hypothetical protein
LSDLGREVETVHGCGVLVPSPGGARKHPHDLELVAVWIAAVDALGGAVAGLAGVGVEVRQGQAALLQFVDGVDLPGEVVEAQRAPRPGWLRADAEQAQVVVVARPGSRRKAACARDSRTTTVMPNTAS